MLHQPSATIANPFATIVAVPSRKSPWQINRAANRCAGGWRDPGRIAAVTEKGLVVARYRGHALVESETGEVHECRLRGRHLSPVVGDNVDWNREPDGTGTMEKIRPRMTTLRRLDSRGRPEVVAANLSQLVVVLAAHPSPDWFLLDRYLCAAELAGLAAVIVYNKIDLVDAPPRELAVYRGLGYFTAPTSARANSGLEALEETLRGQRSTFIGQSGVGKSSLFNALLGDTVQRVGRLSGKLRQGRHTTTTAVLHRHPGGAELIDSPGARNYAPFITATGEVQRGFREIAARSVNCRFDDCTHRAEPDCTVKSALSDGAIDRGRYENYRRLHELTESTLSQRN